MDVGNLLSRRRIIIITAMERAKKHHRRVVGCSGRDSMPAPSSHRTLPASVSYLLNLAHALLFDPSYFGITAVLVIAGDAVLTQFIIRFISCKHLTWHPLHIV